MPWGCAELDAWRQRAGIYLSDRVIRDKEGGCLATGLLHGPGLAITVTTTTDDTMALCFDTSADRQTEQSLFKRFLAGTPTYTDKHVPAPALAPLQPTATMICRGCLRRVVTAAGACLESISRSWGN